MLFKTLVKLKEKSGLSEDLKYKIDVFYALGRLTDAEYNELMDILPEEPVEGPIEEPEEDVVIRP